MNKFEELFKATTLYESLSKDPVHGSTLMLRHEEANGVSYYLNPFTRLANEMFVMGYEAGKEGEPLKPAYFDPTYPPSDIGMNAFGKPVPQERCEEGYNFLLETIGKNHTNVELDHYMTLAVRAVEKDKAAEFMEDMSKIIDVTGCYRLLAILCSGRTRPDPVTIDPPKKEISFPVPHFFSQLQLGMKVKFKGGGTAIISDLVQPDDQGQSFYGIGFMREEDSPHSLSAGYLYSYGTGKLIRGRCDNDEDLDIGAVVLREDLVREALRLHLEYPTNDKHYGEPHPENQQAYVSFGHQRLLDQNKDIYYCRAQFHKSLNRPSISEQSDNPKDLLRALEAHLGTFFGVQTVTVGVHIDVLRGDMQDYANILTYGVPRLFLGKAGD